MKKCFVFGIFWLVFQFYGAAAPELVEAQGVGLRCDTPHCRYVPIHRGHFLGEGRHDYSPYGYGSYAPDALYNRDGITIMNPSPGTTLKVVKKGGGLICLGGLLSIFGCGEETVDFSTAPAASQQTQAKPQAQGAPAYATPAPGEKIEKVLP